MKVSFLSVCFFVLLAFCCSLDSEADELILARGKKLSGEITRVEKNELTLVVGNLEYVINLNTVRDIITESDDPDIQEAVKRVHERVQAAEEKKKSVKDAQSKMAARQKVDVYIMEGCPWCIKMERFLVENGIRYNRYDIDKSKHAYQIYKSKGGDGVPFIVINDKTVIPGYAPDRLMEELGR